MSASLLPSSVVLHVSCHHPLEYAICNAALLRACTRQARLLVRRVGVVVIAAWTRSFVSCALLGQPGAELIGTPMTSTCKDQCYCRAQRGTLDLHRPFGSTKTVATTVCHGDSNTEECPQPALFPHQAVASADTLGNCFDMFRPRWHGRDGTCSPWPGCSSP